MSGINMAELTPQDRRLIHSSLAAACEGPFFGDWEFPTLMGVTRAEMTNVLSAWPDTAHTRPNEPVADLQLTAIRNAMVNLLGYPLNDSETRALEDDWNVDRASVADLLARLRDR